MTFFITYHVIKLQNKVIVAPYGALIKKGAIENPLEVQFLQKSSFLKHEKNFNTDKWRLLGKIILEIFSHHILIKICMWRLFNGFSMITYILS